MLTASVHERERVQHCEVNLADHCFCFWGQNTVAVLGTIESAEGLILQVRVERFAIADGEISLVHVGDLVTAEGSGAPGDRVVIAQESEGYGSRVSELRAELDAVRCTYSPFSNSQAVPIDTAFEALLTDTDECQSLLVAENAGWARSDCDPESEPAQGQALSARGPKPSAHPSSLTAQPSSRCRMRTARIHSI
jgi:hypothetical protein